MKLLSVWIILIACMMPIGCNVFELSNKEDDTLKDAEVAAIIDKLSDINGRANPHFWDTVDRLFDGELQISELMQYLDDDRMSAPLRSVSAPYDYRIKDLVHDLLLVRLELKKIPGTIAKGLDTITPPQVNTPNKMKAWYDQIEQDSFHLAHAKLVRWQIEWCEQQNPETFSSMAQEKRELLQTILNREKSQ